MLEPSRAGGSPHAAALPGHFSCCVHTPSTQCSHRPPHHVHTPSSMQTHCMHTCSLNHSLILTSEPLLLSAHSYVSTPGKAAPWGAAEGRTRPLQESSPSSETGGKTIQCSSPSYASLCTQPKGHSGEVRQGGRPWFSTTRPRDADVNPQIGPDLHANAWTLLLILSLQNTAAPRV